MLNNSRPFHPATNIASHIDSGSPLSGWSVSQSRHHYRQVQSEIVASRHVGNADLWSDSGQHSRIRKKAWYGHVVVVSNLGSGYTCLSSITSVSGSIG